MPLDTNPKRANGNSVRLDVHKWAQHIQTAAFLSLKSDCQQGSGKQIRYHFLQFANIFSHKLITQQESTNHVLNLIYAYMLVFQSYEYTNTSQACI